MTLYHLWTLIYLSTNFIIYFVFNVEHVNQTITYILFHLQKHQHQGDTNIKSQRILTSSFTCFYLMDFFSLLKFIIHVFRSFINVYLSSIFVTLYYFMKNKFVFSYLIKIKCYIGRKYVLLSQGLKCNCNCISTSKRS